MKQERLEGRKALHRTNIGKWAVVWMIYCLVAAGAFGIEEMIPASGPGMTLLMLILFPIVWAYPISEMVAELGSAYPSEGGAYEWAKIALGEFWGWQVGFWGTIGTWLSQATYVVLAVGYLEKFVVLSEMQAWGLKILMVLVFTIINLLGIKEVSRVSTLLSVLVLVGFAAVTIVGFAHWNTNPFVPLINEEEGIIGSLGGSICIAIWMYCGYECMSNCASELEDPQEIPKGLILAMPIIALSYFLPTLAGLASVGDWTDWATDGNRAVGYMDVLINYIGPAAGAAFLVVAILSQCSIFNAYIASGSRGFFVMADDYLFPHFLVSVSKRSGVPHVSIILMGIITMLLCKFDFTTLVMATTPLMLYLYMALSVATHRLRKVYPAEERKKDGLWLIPGGKSGLWICTALPFVISVVALYVNGLDYFILGYIMLLVGILGYLICKIRYGGLTVIDPLRYPTNPRTKLAEGDLLRTGVMLLCCGIAALLGRVLFDWYEGDGGREYYIDMYGSGFLSDFDLMLNTLLIGGMITAALGTVMIVISRKGKQWELRKES